ncbi:2-hydroxyacyl-CoA dehydratase family protein [Diplocloster hominis]|uniref:2-hydroxyacyl-CoA dehydratase subunit D n=1 Tax=Diplocloster hominis TaxID=3079010 RepID=UPI0031BBCD51
MSQFKCVQAAEHVIVNREKLAREARQNGRIVIGHYCCTFPRELITAVGAVPYRITGDVEETPSEVDRVLETTMCPFIRSSIDLALKGRYDFLSAIVVPHACECLEKMYDIWDYYVKEVKHVIFLEVPHMTYDTSYVFYAESIRAVVCEMAKQMGLEVTDENLKKAIRLHNENRTLLNELYELRKADIPPVSATDIHKLVFAGSFMEVEAHNQLLRDAIAEIGACKPEGPARPRVMLHMAQLDDWALLELIDECGADLVVDDMCIGTRAFNFQVDEAKDPYDALAYAYLHDINCPRTYRTESREERFAHITHYAKEYRVSGLIIFITRYCDTHAYDVPILRRFAEDAGLSVLTLEDDYSIINSKGQLKTRIQAFVEML